MKSIFLVPALIAVSAVTAMAQEVPWIEVSGAYTFTPKPSSYNRDVSDQLNRQGWASSLVGNFDDVYGIEVNASGTYARAAGGNTAVHGLMAGPRFTYREKEAFAPYGRALVGVVHRNVADVGKSFLAAQLGGGITIFRGGRLGVVTGGDYRRNFRGLQWDDFTVYVGFSFRSVKEE